MGKNVVLLAINSKYIHSSLAVWLIKAGVSEFSRLSHNIDIVEATIHQPINKITDEVAAHKPDVVGISTYIWNAQMLPSLLKSLNERLPSVIIALGGPEAEHNADYWLEQGADHVLAGEGEYTFPKFLDKLTETSNSQLPSLNSQLSDPYTDDYIASVKNRLIYFESSRGCPFSCAYCLSAETNVKFFPIDIVKKRLNKLTMNMNTGTVPVFKKNVIAGLTHNSQNHQETKGDCGSGSQVTMPAKSLSEHRNREHRNRPHVHVHHVQTIKFVDRTFNCDARRSFELFEHIINLDTSCRFHFEVAADLFDERTLALLKTASPGRIQFEIGLQSFFEPTLKAVSRKTNLDKATRNIKELLQGKNIHIHVDLIAGLPYETLHDFQNSFERAYELKAHVLQLGFLKLLHGSVMRRQADSLKIGYSKEAPYEIQSSPWLGAEDIRVLKNVENALQHTYNKGRFLRTINYVFSVSKMLPFPFYRALGEAAPNHGTALQNYAVQFIDFCMGLPNVERNKLYDHMVCDWLSMVKGKNMPNILRNPDKRQRQEFERIRRELREERGEFGIRNSEFRIMGYDHEIRRDEIRILTNGKTVFVDSSMQCPVTGLYEVSFW